MGSRVLTYTIIYLVQFMGPGASAFSETSMTKSAGPVWGDLYSTLELRHHLNTYYDQDDYLAGQEPSLHGRMKIGTRLYDGMVDLYATVGAYKRPLTQVIYQRRPEVELDFYPISAGPLTLLQYNLVKLPFSAKDELLDEESGRDINIDASQGTIYTVGIAPILRWNLQTNIGVVRLSLVSDHWTKLYSRPQYTSDYTDEMEDKPYSLNDPNEDQTQEPIEEFAPHYYHHGMVGFGFTPTQWPAFAEISGNHVSRFEPKYKVKDGKKDYDYGAERHSFYKIRIRYDLDSKWSITNDFYQYFGGLFASKRREAERRFRNIARISFNL